MSTNSTFNQINGTEYKQECIMAASCGQFVCYCLMLDEKGQVWGYGNAINGNKLYFQPERIPYFVKNKIFIKKICNGNGHNLALDDNGHLYSWGNNGVGQCGIIFTQYSGTIMQPMMIEKLKGHQIVDIKADGDYSYAKSDENLHWVWGDNKYGQLTLQRMNEKYHAKDVKEPCVINDKFYKMSGKTCVIKNVYFGHETMYVVGKKVINQYWW